MFKFKCSKGTFTVIEKVFTSSFFLSLKKEMSVSKDGEIIMGGRVNEEFTPDKFDRENFPQWNAFYDYLSSKPFRSELQEIYQKDLKYWGAKYDFNHKDVKTVLHWATSTDGYVREPHYDSHQRLWNFIIFFNDKNFSSSAATDIL